MVLMNRLSTGLLDVNKVKSHDYFRANDWSNLVAAREARAVRDKEQTAKAAATIQKRKAKDAGP
jgi:hypothetical protein